MCASLAICPSSFPTLERARDNVLECCSILLHVFPIIIDAMKGRGRDIARKGQKKGAHSGSSTKEVVGRDQFFSAVLKHSSKTGTFPGWQTSTFTNMHGETVRARYIPEACPDLPWSVRSRQDAEQLLSGILEGCRSFSYR